MAEKYYNPITDVNYPLVVKAIIETLRVYICETLYRDEEFKDSQKRFILADFSGGDDASIRRSVETFKTTQGKFPFTAYGMWDNEVPSEGSTRTKTGGYYSKVFGCYMKVFPARLTVPMVSFFTTSYDYERAYHLIESDVATPTRLNVPLYINENLTYFPINIDIDVSKGAFAGAFDEYLKIGKIWGLNHTLKIHYHYFSINATDHHGNTPRIALVDDLYANFFSFNKVDYRDNPTLLDTLYNFEIPIVTASVPIQDATGISRTNPIILNFNVSMNEDSVFSNIDFTPFIVADFSWNSLSTQLTIEPTDALLANTSYTITISTDTKSSMNQNFEEEYTLSFTTGS